MNMLLAAGSRLISVLSLLFVMSSFAVIIATPAAAAEDAPQWIFPVVGTDGVDFVYTDTYGACRGGSTCPRTHQGIDIMTYGVKGVPVVAPADGTIKYVNWSSDPNDLNPERCCTLAITHADGWETRYIHLDNDTPGTDDGLGWGIADGILPGVDVVAGQLIGWVGDSGNAESTGPHVQWETRKDGVLENPMPHLDAAIRIPAPGEIPPPPVPLVPPCPEGSACDSVITVDDAGLWGLWGAIDDAPIVDSFYYGDPGDVPFMGDWDGDGVATPGLYRQSDGYVYIRDSNTQGVADREFFFGDPGDVPLVGDFDGDGRDSVSIWRTAEARVYIINELGGDGTGLGAAEYFYDFGDPGDNPFVGDFDGDGVDSVGLYRSSTGFAYFRDSLTTGVADVSFFYGDAGDQILAGDWDGDGDDTVAVYRSSNGRLYINLENEQGIADWDGDVGSFRYVVTAGRSSL
jgi:peptidase M23-like protein